MKVSELAKELKTTSEEILATLKSLKLKAKDSKQELSAAVISVLKSEWGKGKKPVISAGSSKEVTKGTKDVSVKTKPVKKVAKKTTIKEKKEEKSKTKSAKTDKPKGTLTTKKTIKKSY